MDCPKCAGNMSEISLDTLSGTVTVDRCDVCSGMWFDTGEEAKLKNDWMSEFIDIGDSQKVGLLQQNSQISCPRCNKQMPTKADLKQPHISYEICAEHGVFMDAGEFADYKHETLLDIFKDVISSSIIIGNPY